MRYLYFILNILAVMLPLLLSFTKKVRFVQYWKFLFPSIIFAMAIFIPWDIAFTEAGIWGVNPQYITGHFIMGLPMEEWLFFITIPYSIVFTFEVLITYLGFNPFPNISKSYTVSMAVILLLVGMFHWELYTATTFVGLAILLLLHQWVFRSNWMGYFHITYFIILMPYLIFNGILTGGFIDGNIKWYDNTYNLGDRFFTIPIENIFYGMLLMLTVLTPYELMKKYWMKKTYPTRQNHSIGDKHPQDF